MPTAREQESILICTQCGHINPAANKFCGNCGNGLVSLFDAPPVKTTDNRRVVDSGVVSMPDLTNPAAAKPEALPLRSQVVTEEAPSDAVTEEKVPESRPALREQPVSPISGPSFLGLSSDPTSTADYLLADDEPRKGGAFRFLMVLAIIALIVVGALEWRAIRKMVAEQGAKLQSAPTEPAAPSATSSDATPPAVNGSQPAAANSSTTTAPATTSPSDIQQQHPLVEMDLPPQGQQQNQGQPTQQNQPAAPVGNQPASAPQNGQAPPSTNQPAQSDGGSQATQQTPPTANLQSGSGAKVQRASETPGKAHATTLPAKVQEPPKEKPDPAKDPDVLRAEKYLYGPSRNCVAARSLLEQAAGRQNPSAMSHLGAMYATGQCVSADKALAYLWFSRAYEANPENQWLEKNLTMLWRDMSASERQVVLKAKSGK